MRVVLECWENPPDTLQLPYDYVQQSYSSTNRTIVQYCWYLDESCNASFEGDSDIGGYGVFASFIIIAAITTVLGLIKIYTSPEGLRARFDCWCDGGDRDAFLKRAVAAYAIKPNGWHEFAQLMLDPLCDLQVITGAGVVIAGLTEGENLSFYHQAMVADYWWLTINSLFLAVVSTRQAVKAKQYSDFRLRFRQAAILVTVALAIVFLSLQAVAVTRHWDWLGSGKCYRSLDVSESSSLWLWIAGLCLHEATSIAELIFDSSGRLLERLEKSHRGFEGELVKTFKTHMNSAKGHVQNFSMGSGFATSLSLLLSLSLAVLTMVLVVLSLIVRQGLAFWSFGIGTPAFQGLFMAAFFLWNFSDLVTIKIMNAPLLSQDNSSSKPETWGFGQTLPMVLILSVAYMALDAYDTVWG